MSAVDISSLADFTLVGSDGSRVRVSRYMMAARSNVFARLFVDDANRGSDEMAVHYTETTIRHMLDFCVTISLSSACKPDECYDLFRMANEYEMSELMDFLIDEMCINETPEDHMRGVVGLLVSESRVQDLANLLGKWVGNYPDLGKKALKKITEKIGDAKYMYRLSHICNIDSVRRELQELTVARALAKRHDYLVLYQAIVKWTTDDMSPEFEILHALVHVAGFSDGHELWERCVYYRYENTEVEFPTIARVVEVFAAIRK